MIVSHPDKSKGSWSILGDRIERVYPSKSINLTDNLREVKVFGHSEARESIAGRDGLPRAAAGAVLGFLIAGPVGTVLGAGAGASGASASRAGKSESYSVTLTFKNHEFLIGDVSPGELEQLRGFLEGRATATTELDEHKAEDPALLATASKAQSDPYAGLPDPINGRAKKLRPYPVSEIMEQLGRMPETQGVALFFRHFQAALDSLNTIKWRHYDREIDSDLEIAEAISVASSAASHQIHQLSSLSGSADEVLVFLFTYFAPLISEAEIRKAWSNPKPSSVIAKMSAFKIFKKCQSLDTQPEPLVEQEVATSKSGSAAFNGAEIEQKLTVLQDLLERGVISDEEYRAARLNVLGI